MNSWATGSEPRRRRRRRAGTISFSDSLLAARRLKVAAQHRHRAAAINDRPAPQQFGPAVRFHINNPSHRRAASRLTGSMATPGSAEAVLWKSGGVFWKRALPRAMPAGHARPTDRQICLMPPPSDWLSCEFGPRRLRLRSPREFIRAHRSPAKRGNNRRVQMHPDALASAHGRWQVRPMGARLFPRDGALRRWHGVHQLHAGRRDRPRPVSLRTKLRPAGPRQGAVRPQQLFPPESEHPTCALVN